MAGTTPQVKWPYPSSSDLIAQGAVNIEQLAEATEGQFFLPAGSYNGDEPWSTYPIGMSMMAVGTAVTGWPANYGQVVTYRRTNSHSWQWFYTYTPTPERQTVWLRIGYDDTDGSPIWQPWNTVAGLGTPTASATGQITLTPPTGGGTVAGKITFPSGRFSKAPRVVTGLQTRQPGDCNASVFDITSSGATIYAYRTGPTTTTVTWIATEGVDS